MIVFGGTGGDAINPPELKNDGGLYNPQTDTWTPFTAPWINPQTSSVTAWTGSSLIVWDSQGPSPEAPRGGRYFPATDSWDTIARIPSDAFALDGSGVVWTGTKMILWSGQDFMFADTPAIGYAYTASTNSWAAISTTNAPPGTSYPTVAWTGSKMVVFGGVTFNPNPPGGLAPSDAGGIYDPATDAWTTMSASGPSARYDANLDGCWTGTEMIVWAGAYSIPPFSTTTEPVWRKDGGRFNPTTNNWTRFSEGSPSARVGHSAVLADGKVLIWGGQNSLASGPATSTPEAFLGDGATFDPATGEWTPLPQTDAPSARSRHSAVWTGSKMLVWGGSAAVDDGMGNYFTQSLNSGAAYDPTAGTWSAIAAASGPRSGHAAVWTGTQMLVLGSSGPPLPGMEPAVLESYNPATNTWTTLSNQYTDTMGGTSDLLALNSPKVAWTGTHLYVIQGGAITPQFLRYTPATNTWTQLAAPEPTSGFSLNEIAQLHWSGSSLLAVRNSTAPAVGAIGASYDPTAQTWTAFSTFEQPNLVSGGAPPIISIPTKSVWTGSRLIVFGGESHGTPSTIVLPGGGIYDPLTMSWSSSISPVGGPPIGMGTSIWLGGEMFLWGGAARESAGIYTVDSMTDRGFRYRPPQQLHLYVRP